jgi:hypothetical protein
MPGTAKTRKERRRQQKVSRKTLEVRASEWTRTMLCVEPLLGVHGLQQPRRRSARHGWVGSKGPFDHPLQCTRVLRPKETERRSAHSMSPAIVGPLKAAALVFRRVSVLVVLQ